MNRSKQGAQLQRVVLELVQRYLSRQDLPIEVAVEPFDDGAALLVRHTTGVCLRIRVEEFVSPEMVSALRR